MHSEWNTVFFGKQATHTLNLHRKQAKQNLLAQEARVSIATRARERGGLDRNEGERKENLNHTGVREKS